MMKFPMTVEVWLLVYKATSAAMPASRLGTYRDMVSTVASWLRLNRKALIWFTKPVAVTGGPVVSTLPK